MHHLLLPTLFERLKSTGRHRAEYTHSRADCSLHTKMRVFYASVGGLSLCAIKSLHLFFSETVDMKGKLTPAIQYKSIQIRHEWFVWWRVRLPILVDVGMLKEAAVHKHKTSLGCTTHFIPIVSRCGKEMRKIIGPW